MEIKRLQKELTDLYRTTMDYEFRKATYDNRMDSLRKMYEELLEETAGIGDRAEEALESLAACVPEYVAGDLAEQPSKRRKELRSLDHKMNMVSYFLPLMGLAPTEKARQLTQRMVDIWNEKMPEYKIGLSTYEGISGGFRKGLLCYITTAVCRSLGKPDDCYELTALRRYRDDYLLMSDGGRKLVEEYYNIAPTIVKRINREKNADEIYRGIWNDYLSPCIRLIEEGRNEECRDVYSQMVRRLEKDYMTGKQEGDER